MKFSKAFLRSVTAGSLITRLLRTAGPKGKRPARTVVGTSFGAETLNDAAAPVQASTVKALGLAIKLNSNYTNLIAGTPLDPEVEHLRWEKPVIRE